MFYAININIYIYLFIFNISSQLVCFVIDGGVCVCVCVFGGCMSLSHCGAHCWWFCFLLKYDLHHYIYIWLKDNATGNGISLSMMSAGPPHAPIAPHCHSHCGSAVCWFHSFYLVCYITLTVLMGETIDKCSLVLFIVFSTINNTLYIYFTSTCYIQHLHIIINIYNFYYYY